jgi:hypothetical protein
VKYDLDFKEIASKCSIVDVAKWLGLELKRKGEAQWSASCPVGSGLHSLILTPAKERFWCFSPSCKAGGDSIELVSKIKGLDKKAAAKMLSETFLGRTSVPSVPPAESRDLGGVANYLVYDHESLVELGLEPETCKAWGAGYKPKGLFSGRLAIPIHDTDGKLVGYLGHALKMGQEPEVALPKDIEQDQYLIGAHRIDPTQPVSLTVSPLSMLMATQHDFQAVCILKFTPRSLSLLSTWMEEKRIAEVTLI